MTRRVNTEMPTRDVPPGLSVRELLEPPSSTTVNSRDTEKIDRRDRAKKRVLAAHVEEEYYRRFKILMAKLGWTTDAGLRYALFMMLERLEPAADKTDTN